MSCCLLAALLAGKVALAGRIAAAFALKRTAAGLAPAGLVLAGLAVGLGFLAPVGLAQAGHYAERARTHDRSILAEILAAPVCAGVAP